MKTKIMGFIMCVVLIGLSGCAKGKTKISDGSAAASSAGASSEAETDVSLSWEDGRIYAELSDEVLIDAEIVKPVQIGESTEKCRVGADYFDAREMVGKIFPEANLDEWESYVYDGEELLYDGKLRVPLSEKEMEGSANFGYGFNFYTEHWLKCEANLPISESSKGIEAAGDLTGEADFESRESAVKKVEDYFRETVGIDAKALQVYMIEYQDFEEQERKNEANGGDTQKPGEALSAAWSEEDDCYYMFLEWQINGIPLLTDLYNLRMEGLAPMGKVSVAYTANGIEKMSVSDNFVVKSEETLELAKPEVIFEALRQKYELMITDPVTITQIKLIYFPYVISNEEFELIPVWRIVCEQEEREQCIYLEAATGKEVTE